MDLTMALEWKQAQWWIERSLSKLEQEIVFNFAHFTKGGSRQEYK